MKRAYLVGQLINGNGQIMHKCPENMEVNVRENESKIGLNVKNA